MTFTLFIQKTNFTKKIYFHEFFKQAYTITIYTVPWHNFTSPFVTLTYISRYFFNKTDFINFKTTTNLITKIFPEPKLSRNPSNIHSHPQTLQELHHIILKYKKRPLHPPQKAYERKKNRREIILGIFTKFSCMILPCQNKNLYKI